MLPIGDDDSSRRTVPLITYALIALNVLFFFVEQSGGDAFVGQWAFVPRRFLPCHLPFTRLACWTRRSTASVIAGSHVEAVPTP